MDLTSLIMELILLDEGVVEHGQRLVKVVDIPKSDVDVELVLFDQVIFARCVLLVGHWNTCHDRNLDDLHHLKRQWKFSLCRL